MAKAIWALVALVVVAGGGWYVYKEGQKSGMEMAGGDQSPDIVVPFNCKDNTHFIARFVTMDSVQIDVDGTIVRTLPLVEGEGQRYEDDAFAYVFAGEEATVTNKSTNTTTTCEQPFDANNAPFNFGDAGEGGSVKPDTTLVVSESIQGTWQSTSDKKSSRIFKDDGTIIEMYNGESVATGTFKVFTSDKPISVSFPIDSAAVYLQIKAGGTVSNYKVSKLTPESLQLINMDKGGGEDYTFVK